MLTEEIIEYIDRSVLCWLATTSKTIPNVSPKEVFTHYGSSNFVIANIASPQSVANILLNENVCVSFIDVFVQKGFQLKGKGKIINRKDPIYNELSRPLEIIATDRFPIASIIDIKVTSVKPILAPSYSLFPETKEENQVSQAMRTYKVRPNS